MKKKKRKEKKDAINLRIFQRMILYARTVRTTQL